MNAEQVPPRPDGMHPGPGPPPSPVPAPGIGGRPRATWNAWEAVAVYVVAILIGGVSTLPILQVVDDEDVANLAASAVAAVVTVGVLLAWLSTSHHTWRAILGLPAASSRSEERRAGKACSLSR